MQVRWMKLMPNSDKLFVFGSGYGNGRECSHVLVLWECWLCFSDYRDLVFIKIFYLKYHNLVRTGSKICILWICFRGIYSDCETYRISMIRSTSYMLGSSSPILFIFIIYFYFPISPGTKMLSFLSWTKSLLFFLTLLCFCSFRLQ